MAKIITYHGSNDALIWLKTRKGMDSDTELVVPFAHEVVFVKNGKMMDCFATGRYNLGECAVGEGKLFEFKEERIDCRIYYVKKEGSYNIKFEGVIAAVFDPVLKKEVDLDFGGSFSIKIFDSSKFLSKMLAYTESSSISEIKSFFRTRMFLKIKNELVEVMEESGINSNELEEKHMPISKDLLLKMRYALEGYGVSIEDFIVKRAKVII